jgi:hypothetical protein
LAKQNAKGRETKVAIMETLDAREMLLHNRFKVRLLKRASKLFSWNLKSDSRIPKTIYNMGKLTTAINVIAMTEPTVICLESDCMSLSSHKNFLQ